MSFDVAKNIDKIRNEFKNLGSIPKKIIKYGSIISSVCFFIGAALFISSSLILNSVYLQISSISLVKSSFTLFTESIIGGLIFDFLSRGSVN